MKKTIKLCALLAAAAVAIAVTFTGCPDLGFGKDDLFGTWMTLDFVNGEPVSYYTTTGTDAGTYSVTWKFDGKSENMFAGTGGIFKQHLVKYSNTSLSGTPSAETFWYGEYAIKANSSCSKGKLYLYYECGYDMKTGSATLDELWDWDRDDYIRNSGFGSIDDLTGETSGDGLRTDSTTNVKYYQKTNNPVLLQIRKEGSDIKCSDIEYFRFNLKDGSLYGYTRLMATTRNARGGATELGGIYSQWNNAGAGIGTGSNNTFDGGVKIHNGCSWKGDNVRYMGRISARGTPEEPVWMYSNTKSNAELFNLVDNDDDTDYTTPDADIDDKAEQ
ncbi:MAG: hypothetical protein ILP07_13440 [Treponema sp.]|nr:hypothetical protein [Treponema sp.]